jgi:hypothetical protein
VPSYIDNKLSKNEPVGSLHNGDFVAVEGFGRDAYNYQYSIIKE